MPETPRDLTLEINAAHPTIINLNTLRKADPDFAREISLTFLDQVLLSSSIPSDMRDGFDRSQKIMEKYLDESLALAGAAGGPTEAEHPVIEAAAFEPLQDSTPEVEVEAEPILKQAHRDVRGGNPKADQTVVREYTVTGNEKIEPK